MERERRRQGQRKGRCGGDSSPTASLQETGKLPRSYGEEEGGRGWDGLVLDDPSTWNDGNIDQVAASVKAGPLAGYAPAFWNIYKGPFSDIPCNEPLRSIITRAKRSHGTYAAIPDMEYLGDVIAMMGMKALKDWSPERETLAHYIGCRCRPNAEYGRSIIKAHGNRVYAFVKGDQDGSFDVRKGKVEDMADQMGYRKKYVNQPIMPIGALGDGSSEGGQGRDPWGRHGVVDPGFEEVETGAVRAWMMGVCRVTEYEMRICEAVAGYGKCLDARIVREINERVVVPSGRPPMTQEEIYKLNFRVHKRAKGHHREAMEGIR